MKFGNLLGNLHKSTICQVEEEKNWTRHLRCLCDFLEITKKLIAFLIEKKDSLKHNLPHPKVEYNDDHSCCLPSECVADFMAHSWLVPEKTSLHSVQSLFDSPKGKENVEENKKFGCETILLTLWHDDFEPNCTKTNRGSVWIALMTVLSQRSSHVTLQNVYPVAVGEKGGNHEAIIQLLLKDIKKMSK